jgi:chaperonin cofactor prefoldin
LTKEERIARLEKYLETLEKEAQAVREHIDEMTG